MEKDGVQREYGESKRQEYETSNTDKREYDATECGGTGMRGGERGIVRSPRPKPRGEYLPPEGSVNP